MHFVQQVGTKGGDAAFSVYARGVCDVRAPDVSTRSAAPKVCDVSSEQRTSMCVAPSGLCGVCDGCAAEEGDVDRECSVLLARDAMHGGVKRMCVNKEFIL